MHYPTCVSVVLLCHVSRVVDGHMPAHSVFLFRVDFRGSLPAQSGFIMYPGNGDRPLSGWHELSVETGVGGGGKRTSSAEETVYPGLLYRIS